jgi:hypothetical protein
LIEVYTDRETTGATKGVDDAEPSVQQEWDDAKKAENAGLMNRELKMTFQEMMVIMGDCLSDLASSDDTNDGEDKDEEETEQGQQSEDEQPSRMMGTVTQTVQQRRGRFRQNQITVEEWTQLRWEDAAAHFHEREKKNIISALLVLADIQPQTADNGAAPVLATIGELMECHNIVPRISPMPQGTSRGRSRHCRIRSRKPQSTRIISSLVPGGKPDSTH